MTSIDLLYGYTSRAAIELFPDEDITVVDGVPHRTIGPNDVAMSDEELALISARAAEFAVPLPRRIGSSREFLQLFTQEERIAIHASTNEVVQDWVLIALGGEFSLDHEDTAAGTGALVSLGIITARRRDEILNNDFDNPVITLEE